MNTDRKYMQSMAVVALATGLLLLIPLVAMQFFDEVVWTATDFLVIGILLFGTGLTYKLVTRKSGDIVYRIAVGFALLAGLFLIWVNLSVGIIGSEQNPANLMYIGVLAVGIIGALMVQFQAPGMTGTMFGMALAQALVAGIALSAGMHKSPTSSMIEILGVNGFFIALFVISALIFRYAAYRQTPTNAESEG